MRQGDLSNMHPAHLTLSLTYYTVVVFTIKIFNTGVGKTAGMFLYAMFNYGSGDTVSVIWWLILTWLSSDTDDFNLVTLPAEQIVNC